MLIPLDLNTDQYSSLPDNGNYWHHIKYPMTYTTPHPGKVEYSPPTSLQSTAIS